MSITNQKYPGFPLLNKCKGILNNKKAQSADSSLTLTIELPSAAQKDSIRFLIQKENDPTPEQLSFCPLEDSSFLLDLSPLKEEVTFGKKVTFCFFIECIQDGEKQLYALKEETPPSVLADRYRLFAQNLWLSPSPDVLPVEYVGIAAGKVNMEDFFCAALCSRNHYLELSHSCNLPLLQDAPGKAPHLFRSGNRKL